MFKKLTRPALFLLALGLLISTIAQAQKANTGGINGTVTDKTGAALKNIAVSVTSIQQNVTQTTTTNEQGVYRFPYLPIGDYSLSFKGTGFADLIRDDVDVTTGFNIELNVTLTVAGEQQSIVVTGEVPLIDTQNSNVLNNIETEEMGNLPNSRDIGSVQGLLPGTRVTTPDVGGSQAGSITTNSSYGISAQLRSQIEGINTTEGKNSVGMYFDYGDLQEVSITTAANDASMPVPGQFVNLVLKSGTNKFHGSFYQDYENSALQGTNIDNLQRSQGAGNGQRITSYHDTNADIGGPILRDKLWFYGSARNQKAGRTITGFPVENPNSNFDFITKVEDLSYKISWQINPKHRITQFMQWDRKLMPSRGAANNYYLNAVYKTNLPSIATNIQYEGTLTPHLYATVRFGGWGYNSMNYHVFESGETAQPLRTELLTGDVSGTFGSFNYIRRRKQFEPVLTYFSDHFLHTSHQIKIGVLTERESYKNQQKGTLDQYSLVFNSAAGSADFTTPYTVTIANTPSVALDTQQHNGAFIQDQIRIGRRLIVNLGARWDYYRVFENNELLNTNAPYAGFFYGGSALPNGYSIAASYASSIPGQQVLRYPLLFAPRAGIVWDLTGKGKTVFKANFGTFYSNPAPDFGSTVNRLQKTTYTFKWNDLNADRQFTNNELGAFVSNTGGANVTVTPHIQAPLTQEASVYLEHQLNDNLSLRAGFVYRKLNHDWQKVDIARTASLYTKQVTAFDPGIDGVKNTSDDVGNITVYDIPTGTTVPASVYQWQTPDGNNSNYKNFEFTINKRAGHHWSFTGTYLYTFNNYLVNGVPTNPNEAINNELYTADWTSHASGTYTAPWGILITPIGRFQSGANLSRVLNVTGLRVGTFATPVQAVGSYRAPDLFYFDTRLQKQFKLRSDRFRADVIFDTFNLFNTNANISVDNVTGVKSLTLNGVTSTYQRFLATTGVTPPRVFRLGARLTF